MAELRGEAALFLAWGLALAASLTVLFIGEVLGQAPCTLCWFQRAFMFPLAVLLGLGLWWQDRSVARYAIALAGLGAVFALWHLALFVRLVPEQVQPCTATGPSCTDQNQLLFGVPIPALSLLSFGLIAALSAISRKETPA
ncbi:disulfide bond formation protein B [Tranquillimonas alkanivorans]|nr:disulfide bond formation protein B [Tranquillimonas alkanivorans]